MGNAAAPPVGIDRNSGPLGFVRAVLHRANWRVLAVAAPVAFALWEIILAVATQSPTDPVILLMMAAQYPDEIPLRTIFIERLSMIHLIQLACLTGPLLIALLAADEAVERGRRRLRAYGFALVAGAFAGVVAQYSIIYAMDWPHWGAGLPWEISSTEPVWVFITTVIFGGFAFFTYVSIRASFAATRRMQAAEMERAQATRRTLESHLQAMQARVEPQFLFNTLAQVRTLNENDPAIAGEMLDDLITYLRAALPHLRESSSTLGKEIELAKAYLNIMQVRLGERLSFTFDVPEATRDARMPPMILLPLIDHALVHGHGPVEDGGRLAIATEVANGRLRLSVTETAGGFVEGVDATQLKNIEDRVRALYGDAGRFRIERMQQQGACATLEIPYVTADTAARTRWA